MSDSQIMNSAGAMLADGRTDYLSWLVVPMRVTDSKKSSAYFADLPKYPLALSDLTIKARSMFEDSERAIGACWRLGGRRVVGEMLGAARNVFSVSLHENAEKRYPFELFTTWVFIFHSGIALLCLGIRQQGPQAAFMLSSFGLEEQLSAVYHEGKRIAFTRLMLDWTEKRLGLSPFFADQDRDTRANQFFCDSCLYNIALRGDRFADMRVIRKAVRNLHLGLEVNDPRDDLSEEDVAYVYGAKDMETDAPGKEGQGSYRWGCCITSQTLNYLYGGVDFYNHLEASVEDYVMEGLPLMIIALQQRYSCFMLIEKLNVFSKLSRSQREKLQEEMTQFITYGTLSASAISRWNNVKRIYSHISTMMDTEDAVKDITKKLDQLISESEKRSQKTTENANRILSVFGTLAIPASVIDLVRTASGNGALWEKVCAIVIPALLGALFLAMRLRSIAKDRFKAGRKELSFLAKKEDGEDAP